MMARWLRRGAAALGGLALDAAVDSLELGKRCAAWVSHSFGARGLMVAALVVLVASLVARGHERGPERGLDGHAQCGPRNYSRRSS